MGWFDFILGEKKVVNDDFLGSLIGDRVRENNLHKECSWYASFMIEDAPEPATIIIAMVN
jgi:hypothetical protein